MTVTVGSGCKYETYEAAVAGEEAESAAKAETERLEAEAAAKAAAELEAFRTNNSDAAV